MSGTIGVDESNHGNHPEFFFAVLALTEDDFLPRELIGKRKARRGIETVMSYIGGNPFRFIVVDAKDYDDLSQNQGRVRAAVLTEFNNAWGGLDHIMVDGDEFGEEEDCRRFFFPDGPTVEYFPDGDHKRPILNKADALARVLYRISSDETLRAEREMFEARFGNRCIRADFSKYAEPMVVR